MAMRWCFQCGLDYDDTVAACVECGVETVEYEPTPAHEVGTEDDGQLAYELHSWPYEARAEAERLLHEQGMAHGWQGPSLIVLEADEEAADELLAAIDSGDDAVDAPTIDLEAVDEVPEPAEGPEAWQVIEGLFLSSDVLARNPRDGRAFASVKELAAVAGDMTLPFGFDAPVWSAIQLSSAELSEALDVEGGDDAVADQAAALATILRPYV